MAAGLGYIEFATGDILTAAVANGYLASQTVMVFADSSARSTAITSPQEGMISYLKDTNAIEYYSGSAWVAVSGGSSGGQTLISTTTLSGSSTTISATLTSYKHVFMVLKMVQASGTTGLRMRLNGDTGANYSTNIIQSTGTSANGRSAINATSFLIDDISSGSAVRAALNGAINLYRVNDTNEIVADWTTRNDDGVDYGTVRAGAIYDAAAAVSSITFLLDAGTFSAGTVYLYGVN